MTTQLPNGYEAVKVPEGAYDFCLDADGDLHFAIKGKSVPEEYDFEVLPGFYSILGRADELTGEQIKAVVDTKIIRVPSPSIRGRFNRIVNYINYLEKYGDSHGCLTALESFRSLLATLHLEPHTTIILKKENV